MVGGFEQSHLKPWQILCDECLCNEGLYVGRLSARAYYSMFNEGIILLSRIYICTGLK